MRYQDWDVLLFPRGTASIPLQEFRTACYAGPDVPTLNTFIASLKAGEVFQVSVHRWTAPAFSAQVADLGQSLGLQQAVWGVMVTVDGVTVANETLASGDSWPQMIGSSHDGESSNPGARLVFPTFHNGILSQHRINVTDDIGRIKVHISEGFNLDEGNGVHYCPIKPVVCFSFMHAPLSFLQNRNIAWPNPTIRSPQPLLVQPALEQYARGDQTVPAVLRSHSHVCQPPHVSDSSDASVPSTASMGPPPGPNATLDHMFGTCDGNYDLSNRDTSDSRAASPKYNWDPTPNHTPRYVPPVTMNMEMMMSLVSVHNTSLSSEDGVSMAQVAPPTPAERGRMHEEAYEFDDGRQQRESRNYSDVSMHANCDQFPHCTIDDPAGGGVIHSPLSAHVEPSARSSSTVDAGAGDSGAATATQASGVRSLASREVAGESGNKKRDSGAVDDVPAAPGTAGKTRKKTGKRDVSAAKAAPGQEDQGEIQ